MKYDLFLFDADDTLFDFRRSEAMSFRKVIDRLGAVADFDSVFSTYRRESAILWGELEQDLVTKDFLKVERFRRTFVKHNLDFAPEEASRLYLEILPETVVLLDAAEEICASLSQRGEIGIVTNGIESVQKSRLKKSAIASYVSFMAVSEECGYAKPDVRFFEHSVKMAKRFEKSRTLVIGDRLETDIQGAHNFGLDACLFNPGRNPVPHHLRPKYEIFHLSEVLKFIEQP